MKQFIMLLAVCLLICFFPGCRKDKIRKDDPPGIALVPLDFARAIAQKFNPQVFLHQQNGSRAAFDSNAISSYHIIPAPDGSPAIYVFNFKQQKGFVFISADFKLRPVLAYIDKGEYQAGARPPGFDDWLNRTKENLSVVRTGLYNNTVQSRAAWHAYVQQYNVSVPDSLVKQLAPPPTDIGGGTGGCEYQESSSAITVGPLVPVTWGQTCTYNDLVAPGRYFACTICENGKPPTGCIATAMAQIMRYHRYPPRYNYAAMPADRGNVYVQELMKDAGQSVGMLYDCTGSGAHGYDMPHDLIDTFGYASADRWGYDDATSYLKIKSNLNRSLPVILEGFDPDQGGHAWVCDGYQESTVTSCHNSTTFLTLHMNWGWHEVYPGADSDYNGWYAFDNWYIYGLNWNFHYSKHMIIEIRP